MIHKIMLLLIFLSLTAMSQSWQNAAGLKYPRAGAAATAWDGKIYVFGGKSLNNKVLNNVEVYDPLVGVWDTSAVPAFRQARYNASICVWEDKFFLTGGRTIDGTLKSMEIYDPVENAWSEAHDLRREREGHTTNYFNGRIYIIGGQKDSDNLIENVEWFDYQDEQWKDAQFELPYPRSAHFAAINNDDYYMFGGYYYGLTNTIYKATKNPEGYSWQQAGLLSTKRAYGATAIIDSLVYLIGGETETGKTNLMEIFNLNSGTLDIGMGMSMSHSGMTSAVLNKKIYIIGGYESYSNDPIDHVHVYLPAVTSLEDEKNKQPYSNIITKTYPNPFNGQVNIEIETAQTSDVALSVYNVTGQLIYTTKIVVNRQTTYAWNAKDNNQNDIPSGIYFLLIKSARQQRIVKLTYVK